MVIPKFTGEIVKPRSIVYAVFEGEWSWGNRAMTSAGSLRNGLVWKTGQERAESLKALAALEACGEETEVCHGINC